MLTQFYIKHCGNTDKYKYMTEMENTANLSYADAIEYIKSLDVYGSVLGLDNMRILAEELDNPQEGLKFVHVTGTNGKGSVCAFLTSILKEAGYKVGSYNSPAVLSDIDQFRINMTIISKELYAEAVSIVRSACERVAESHGIHPTRFEVETMVAFVAFYIEKCDIVVLETGLGGRDDATNIINNTMLHVFTSISMDHSAVLGDTLLEIAEVKSGIIKTSAPVLMYDRLDAELTDVEISDVSAVNDYISKKSDSIGSSLYTVSDKSISNVTYNDGFICFDMDEYAHKSLKLSMRGAYQPINAAIAVKAAHILAEIGYNITDKDIAKGLKKATIPFRFEKYTADHKVDIILDGAHNEDGAKQLVKSLEFVYPDREFIFVSGIFKDKDYEKIAKLTANKARKIIVIQNEKSERSLDKDVLCSVFEKYNNNVKTADDIDTALYEAIEEATCTICANATHPVVICFGSLSWLRDAKKCIKSLKRNIENKTAGENKLDSAKIKQGIELILEGIGEDLNREGLKDTPDRVARMYEEIFAGIGQNAQVELERTFSSDAKEMVIEKDIPFYSMCEHHLLPFYGQAHIAYIPDGKVVGISKLARCVDIYAKKPQIQEKLTEEIADAIMKYLKPKGVMVMLEAEHMCMTMRGVKKPGTKTVTLSVKGKMQKKENKDLFFQMIGK